MVVLAFCKGEVAKMSPNSADDFLKPVVPALAMLLLVTPMAAVAALIPVRDVKKAMLSSD